MNDDELTPAERRLVYGGLQADEQAISTGTPDWSKVRAAFGNISAKQREERMSDKAVGLPSLHARAYLVEYLADGGRSFAPLSLHLARKMADEAAARFGGTTRVIELVPAPDLRAIAEELAEALKDAHFALQMMEIDRVKGREIERTPLDQNPNYRTGVAALARAREAGIK